MDGQIPLPPDTALRLMNGQTLSASGDGETTIDLGSGYAPQPDNPLRLVVNVEAVDFTTGNETYVADVQESDDGSTGWVSTGLKFSVAAAVGPLTKVFSSVKRYVKLVWTLAGTTPSVKASAWLQRA